MRQITLFLAGLMLLGIGIAFGQSSANRPMPQVIIDPITHAFPRDVNTVKVRVLIGTDGRVKRFISCDASKPLVPWYKIASAQWSFTPATRDGRPVDAYINVTFSYSLRSLGYSTETIADDIGR